MVRKVLRKTIWLAMFMLIVAPLKAQTPNADEKLHWWGDIDGFINQQDQVTLNLVSEALTKYRPSLNEPMERKMAMLMLDGVLHEEHAATRPAVQHFLQERLDLALQKLKSAKVTEGAMIWKLYNHGFIVKTPTVTIAFDMVRAHSVRTEGFSISDETMRELVSLCDILFISHRHRDHADKWVAQTFIDQGKKVVTPPEVWKDDPIHGQVSHLEREAQTEQEVVLAHKGQKLKVINHPGHQGSSIENNVPLVFTPEGLSFAQTGDQSGPETDWDWIDAVGSKHKVDVLFPNCWTPEIQRMIKGFKPKLVITGHENEMGHTIDHRESNWLTYTRLKGATVPYIVMTWGEFYHYK